jgi:LacI family transcriptional regulator
LLDLGHRHIALINGECRHTYASDRKRGFLAAVTERGVTPDAEFMCEAPMQEDIAHRQASALLAHAAPPSAFLCSSIAQALGVIRACREAGRDPGRDIAIIAHDDRLPELRAETIDPPLTTTQSSIGDAGRRIVELAVGLLRDPNAALPSEVWPVDLVVRGSTPPNHQHT